MGGGFTFTGLGWTVSAQASGVTRFGWPVLGGFTVLLGPLEVAPFNCKFEISSTLRSELIEGSRALSGNIFCSEGLVPLSLGLTIALLR